MDKGKSVIRGKVAKVLNTREVALNVGSKEGVEVGMLFNILDAKGENICDPDTGETLGSILRPKIKVKISSVQERFSVARTYRKVEVNIGGRGPNIAPLAFSFMPPKIITKDETFKTDETTWEDLEESESFVKTGDPVIQIFNEDYSF